MHVSAIYQINYYVNFGTSDCSEHNSCQLSNSQCWIIFVVFTYFKFYLKVYKVICTWSLKIIVLEIVFTTSIKWFKNEYEMCAMKINFPTCIIFVMINAPVWSWLLPTVIQQVIYILYVMYCGTNTDSLVVEHSLQCLGYPGVDFRGERKRFHQEITSTL